MEGKEVVILAVIGGFTVGHILFIAAWLWISNRGFMPNRLISFLLLCFTVRVVKSITLLIFPNFVFESPLIALGVIGMSAIGPLTYFYTRSLLQEPLNFTLRSLVHLIPAAVLSFFAFFLTDYQMFHVYQLTVYHIIIYLIISGWFVYKNRSHNTFKWLTEFLIASALMAMIFAIQLYTTNRVVYITVSVSATVILYAISLRAAFRKEIFRNGWKKKRKPHDPELFEKIQLALTEKKLYLDPLLTVNKLSQAIKIPAHVISSIINEQAQSGFSEYINEYRILDAEKKLVSDDWSNYSIEAIAYDSGFNSLSAFYNSFKKVKKVSPARYRKGKSS